MKTYKSVDYTIQQAMVDMAKSHKGGAANRPDYIIFDGVKVKTSHWMVVPERFKIKVDFLSAPDTNQGMDIHVDAGYVELEKGERIKTLRSWHNPKYEPRFEYTGFSKTQKLSINNVYTEQRGDHRFEEKWTENAGMIVEPQCENTFLFRCSPGHKTPPDYDALVFSVTIEEE
ncbi:hypothetical protein [Aliiglaciecola sp. M165]|uniref:hypothetical protein n=1 Tax=Aliiglaciecola sp. M165 TaxID=2593649 RepID=UPI00117EB504|nr:hypothetical protein [Aliiglaciecola sp. M165]TRY33852.1 hypothetical protein FM019_00915 [Aliiglaciecola sp. M165]